MVHELAEELIQVVDGAAAEMRALDVADAAAKRRPDVWSIKEIVGHLVDSAANNHQRFVRAQHVEALTFPEYKQDEWVRAQDHQGASWEELIAFWQLYNHRLAHIIRRIPEARLDVRCAIGSGEAITLGYLLEDYVVHLRHHLKQIKERSPE